NRVLYPIVTDTGLLLYELAELLLSSHFSYCLYKSFTADSKALPAFPKECSFKDISGASTPSCKLCHRNKCSMYSCACSVANVQRVDTITPYFLSISAVMVNTSYMLFAAIPDGRRACPAIKIVFISSPLSQLKN